MSNTPRDPFEEKYGSFYDAYHPDRLETRKALRQVSEISDAEKRKNRRKRARISRKAWRRRIAAVLLLIAVTVGAVFGVRGCSRARNGRTDALSRDPPPANLTEPAVADSASPLFAPVFTENTAAPGEKLNSTNAILINATQGTVLASKGGTERIRPASLTKLMTALVAAEHISDRNTVFTFSYELLHPLYNSDLIMIGYEEGEQSSLNDLFYGMLMLSGADSALALAEYVAGSEEAFVRLMNDKAAELGLTDTHFDNVVGTDSDGLYSTCYDMAVILQAALSDDFLRTVISTEDYTLPATEFHPDGITLKNSMFAKMFGTEPEVAVIQGGKTGFTAKAGFCLASYAEGNDGSELIAVSVGANGSYRPIYDSFTLYRKYSGLSADTGDR